MALQINEKSIVKLGETDRWILYRAKDGADGRELIIKAAKPAWSSEASEEALQRELAQARALPLNEILRPVGSLTLNGSPALAYENAPGRPLGSCLEPAPMPLGVFMGWAAALTDAVHRLHELGLLHLTLSPDAFWVDPEQMTVCLTELGGLMPMTASAPATSAAAGRYSTEALRYAAPEQAGLIGSAPDARTDVYALGVIFYRMLTGVWPFAGEADAELLHQHEAPLPAPPHEQGCEVPRPLSTLVMTCLAKQPEERYQSVHALQQGLDQVLKQLTAGGFSEEFELPPNDALGRFTISDRIYGRESELVLLQQTYRSARKGRLQTVFVSGISGIGKSYLIHEFQKSIEQEHHLFIHGKFDQYKRETPYHAIHQAGKQLLQHLLSLPESEFRSLRQQILDAVSPNGQVLVEMNPDFEKILGEQPPLAKLPPAEMHNRFIQTLQNYMSVFMSREQSLILFLDDLQWADAASIQLISDLCSALADRELLLLCAYREEELPACRALQELIELRSNGSSAPYTTRIRLEPLLEEHIIRLLEDTLRPAARPVMELAQLMLNKTKGNPFFTKQFFRSLYDQQLLHFSPENGGWDWEHAKINELYITENVVDFMIGKIRRLTEPMQHLLKHAACIGHQFAPETLILVTGLPADRLHTLLRSAVDDNLLLRVNSGRTGPDLTPVYSYKFLHDRVYQAVYSLVSASERQRIHLHIGRILQVNYSASSNEDRLFEMTNQLNLGSGLITSPQERTHLAQLNLSASRRAKANSAYDTAHHYANAGVQLLPSDAWRSDYDLAFALRLELAGLQYLCGQFDVAKESFSEVLEHARTKLDQVEIYNLMMVLHTNLGEHEETLRIGFEGLRLLGISLKPDIGQLPILWEIVKSRVHLGLRRPEELLDHPLVSRPEHDAIMKLIINLIAPSYFISPNLYIYLMLRLLNFSLRYGHGEGSAFAYSTYGLILGAMFGRQREGAAYGHLSVKLSESFQHTQIKTKVYFGYGTFTNNINQHIAANVGHLRKAYQLGLESGDFVYAGYSITFSFFLQLFKGDPLPDVQKEMDAYQGFVHKAKDRDVIWIYTVLQRFILLMQEELPAVPEPAAGREAILNKEELSLVSASSNKAVIHTYYVMQAQAYYLLHDYDRAREVCEEAEAHLGAMFGFSHVEIHHFQYGMVLAAIYTAALPSEQRRLRQRIRKSLRILRRWSRYSPDNYLHLRLLLEAEWLVLLGRHQAAAAKYDEAIRAAGTNRFTLHEALACERAADFYRKTDQLAIARSYMTGARTLYLRSGFQRKADQLQERCPALLSPGEAEAADASLNFKSASDMKTSRSVPLEEVLEFMLENVMTIVIENAGADKGFLVLERDDQLFIAAGKSIGSPFQSLNRAPLMECREAAVKVIEYAAATGETVMLSGLRSRGIFAEDDYLLREQPHSVLCLPVRKGGELLGTLYLENRRSTDVFEADRWDTVKRLAGEAAGLIEHLRLHADLEPEELETNIRLQQEEQKQGGQPSGTNLPDIHSTQSGLIHSSQTVHSLLTMNQHEMAREHVSECCREIGQHAAARSASYSVLGAVLTHFFPICAARRIDLQLCGKLDCLFEELGVPDSYFSSIVHHLLKNAVEAVPEEDVLRTVRLTIREEPGCYRLEVLNSGSYVAPEDRQQRLFDQVCSSKSESSSPGAGLHIVQSYLQHYGGQLHCESGEGRGTTFHVLLPKRVPGEMPRAAKLSV